MLRAAAISVVILCAIHVPAFAVSKELRKVCAPDYSAYCSQHEIGSQGLRTCMRANRKKLTEDCIQALGRSDEVTKEDVETYRSERGR